MADKYNYHLQNGGLLTLEGDTMPSDSEVESIAKEKGVTLVPHDTETKVDNPPTKVSDKPSKLSELWKHALTGHNTEIDQLMKDKGITDIKGPGLMTIPGLSNLGERIKNKGINSGDYWKGFGGSIANDLLDLISSGFDPRNAAIKKSPMDLFPIEHDIPVVRTPEIAQRAMEHPIQPPLDVARDFAPVGEEGDLLQKKLGLNGKALEEKNLDLMRKEQNMSLEMPEEMYSRRKNPNLTVDQVNDIFANPPALKEGTTVNFNNAKQSIKNKKLNSNKPLTGQIIRNKDYEKLWNNLDENSFSDALDRHLNNISKETDPEIIKDNYNNWNIEYESRKLHGTPDDIETAGTLRDEALDKLRQLESNQPNFDSNINKYPNFGSDKPKINNEGPRVTSLKPATPELIAQAQAKGPNTIFLKTADKTQLENAAQYGYTFDSIASDGSIKLKKSPINFDLSNTSDIFNHIPDINGLTLMTGERVRDMTGMEPKEAIAKGIIEQDPETMKYRTKQNNRNNEPPINNGGGNDGGPPDDNGGNGHIGDIVDRRKATIAQEVMNLPRGIMASWDLSAPFRQGLGLIHRPEWWKSWGSMFKSFGDENAFRAVQDNIAQKPLFKSFDGQASFAEKAGLKLTDLTDLSSREEQVMSTWAEKVPGVRASNRAYTGFLNKLRADTFESLIDSAKVINQTSGEIDMKLAKELAEYVNNATGRGSLGSLEKYAPALNSIFFSPRLIASRLQMLNPVYYMTANSVVRKEAIKSLLSVAGAGQAITQLGKFAGGTIENDPVSSDFGKLKIGNTRIDPYGGFQQYIVAANRLLQGRTKSSVSGKETDLNSGKYGSQTKLDVAERFGESKLNPLISLATTILRGKNLAGQKVDLPEEVASKFVPLFMQDLKNVATENPSLIPFYSELGLENTSPSRGMLAIPGAFGFGVQNYQSK